MLFCMWEFMFAMGVIGVSGGCCEWGVGGGFDVGTAPAVDCPIWAIITSDMGLYDVFDKPCEKSPGGDIGELTKGECNSFPDEEPPACELLGSGLGNFFSKLSIIAGG